MATGEPVTTSLDLLLSWFSPDVEATTAVAWADVDDDGDLELAVANRNAPDRLLINLDGTLTYDSDNAWSSQLAATTTDLAWGDVDRDGDLDLITATAEGVRWFANDSGVLAASSTGLADTGELLTEVLWADLNRDGFDELLTLETFMVSMFEGGPQGLSSQPTWQAQPETFAAMAIGLGDGDLDLAVGNTTGARLYLNQGGPLFAIAVAEKVTSSQPRLMIQQVSGPAAAISVTQPFSDGQPAVVQVLRPALGITVTQSDLDGELNVQVFPAYRIPYRRYTALSPWAKDIPNAGESSAYRTVVPVDYPLFAGFVRVWSKNKEAVSQFFISRERSADGRLRWGAADGFTMGVDNRFGLGPDDRFGGADDRFGMGPDDRFGSADDRFGMGPDDRFGSADDRFGMGPDDRFGGADYRGYGANRRSLDAPIASEDAQVIIFNRGDVLGDPGALSLQALASIPNLPSWLTSAGRGYRFEASASLPRTIAFSYLRREVPEGYEQNLQVYYSPDEGATW